MTLAAVLASALADTDLTGPQAAQLARPSVPWPSPGLGHLGADGRLQAP